MRILSQEIKIPDFKLISALNLVRREAPGQKSLVTNLKHGPSSYLAKFIAPMTKHRCPFETGRPPIIFRNLNIFRN